jgi:hypothetical protein
MNLNVLANIDHCSMLAEYHAHHIKPEKVPTACKQLVMNHSNHLQKIETSDGLIQVYGFKNMIYVDTYEMKENKKVLKTSHLLAGSETKLSEVISLEINEQENKLYVLNRNHDDASFGSYNLAFIGNVAPLRSFSSKELNDVINFRIDPDHKEVYFLGQGQKVIKVFNIDADKEGKLVEHSVKMKFSLSRDLVKTTSLKDLAVGSDKLLILDEDKVIVLPKRAKMASGIKTIVDIGSSQSSPIMLALDAHEQNMIVINQSGAAQEIAIP